MRHDDRIRFNGFSGKTVSFLKGIKKNNHKGWFDTHRDDYTAHVLTPMQDLFSAVEKTMLAIDPHFMIDPRPGKGITRPHRDTRFSPDKSPYKSTIWFTYRRAIKEWFDYPAFYFEIMTDGYRYGAGYFSATRQTMTAFREIIDTDMKRFKKAADTAVKKGIYSVEGELYARPLKKLPDDIAVWYNRKSLYLIKTHTHDDLFRSPELVDMLCASFRTLKPIYEIMLEASESWRKTAPR
jgi:uncharacterized protein (TIGR02453 family)